MACVDTAVLQLVRRFWWECALISRIITPARRVRFALVWVMERAVEELQDGAALDRLRRGDRPVLECLARG